jgi:hypothetical protein
MNLPTEIWEQIIDECSLETILDLRKSSRYMQALCIKPFLESIVQLYRVAESRFYLETFWMNINRYITEDVPNPSFLFELTRYPNPSSHVDKFCCVLLDYAKSNGFCLSEKSYKCTAFRTWLKNLYVEDTKEELLQGKISTLLCLYFCDRLIHICRERGSHADILTSHIGWAILTILGKRMNQLAKIVVKYRCLV